MNWLRIILIGVVILGGCSKESLRVALEAQQRADQVQAVVFEKQHEALCVLMYRDLKARLAEAGVVLSDEQRAVVNEVWNERDLVEFWRVQYERSRALRLAGVDGKLYADQSPADLLYKTLRAKVQRGKQGAAGEIGEAISDFGLRDAD